MYSIVHLVSTRELIFSGLLYLKINVTIYKNTFSSILNFLFKIFDKWQPQTSECKKK